MEKENTTQNNDIKLLNADDIIDKFDLIHGNKEEEEAEKCVTIDFLGGALPVQKLEQDELQECFRIMISKDVEYGANKFIFLSIPTLQNEKLFKKFKTKDGAKLVERIFIGNEDRKTAVFNKLLNLNKINRMENDSVRMMRISELEKK